MSWVTWCYWLLIVKLSLCSGLATDTSCPTWHYYNNATGQCECGHLLLCSSEQVDIKINYCAKSSEQEDDYYASYCPFTHTLNSTNRMYSEMPSNASQLDEVMCGPYNRRGLLCGECKDGYGLAVYSFDLKCVNCSSLLVKICNFSVSVSSVCSNNIDLHLFCCIPFQHNFRPTAGICTFLPDNNSGNTLSLFFHLRLHET